MSSAVTLRPVQRDDFLYHTCSSFSQLTRRINTLWYSQFLSGQQQYAEWESGVRVAHIRNDILIEKGVIWSPKEFSIN